MNEIFPGELPDGFAKGFDWKKDISENDDIKREVAKLLAEHPERSKQIIGVYKTLFLGDCYTMRFLWRLDPTWTREKCADGI